MFASHIGGEMLLTTSTHQIILFKYAKVGQNKCLYNSVAQ